MHPEHFATYQSDHYHKTWVKLGKITTNTETCSQYNFQKAVVPEHISQMP